jgi:enamine deaminase RidA (YjgF/YER057c/UK114 family)
MSTQHQIKRFHISKRYSEMAIYAGVVYLGGQVTNDTSLDITGQTQDVLLQIDSLLAQAGSDKKNILRAEIFLADLGDYDSMNRVWDAWVAEGHAPPRATVQAKLADPAFKIEIIITAAV